MTAKILVVGHAAHRSGAPIILLQFLRWLQQREDVYFDIKLLHGGPLVSDFAAIGQTEVLRRQGHFTERVARRLTGRARWEEAQHRAFGERAREKGYDAAYVNTVVPTKQM